MRVLLPIGLLLWLLVLLRTVVGLLRLLRLLVLRLGIG